MLYLTINKQLLIQLFAYLSQTTKSPLQAVTYRQYYIKLITLLGKMEKFNEEQYQKLKDDSDFLNKEDRNTYSDLQNELYSVMQKCEKVASLISTKEVKSTDEIDAAVLGFLPTEII